MKVLGALVLTVALGTIGVGVTARPAAADDTFCFYVYDVPPGTTHRICLPI